LDSAVSFSSVRGPWGGVSAVFSSSFPLSPPWGVTSSGGFCSGFSLPACSTGGGTPRGTLPQEKKKAAEQTARKKRAFM
jgi:hypothetical protein